MGRLSKVRVLQPTTGRSSIARPWGFSLREIKMPIHIWHGEADTLVSVKQARILAEAIPDARTRFFPNEGHVLIVSHFEELLNVAVG